MNAVLNACGEYSTKQKLWMSGKEQRRYKRLKLLLRRSDFLFSEQRIDGDQI